MQLLLSLVLGFNKNFLISTGPATCDPNPRAVPRKSKLKLYSIIKQAIISQSKIKYSTLLQVNTFVTVTYSQVIVIHSHIRLSLQYNLYEVSVAACFGLLKIYLIVVSNLKDITNRTLYSINVGRMFLTQCSCLGGNLIN